MGCWLSLVYDRRRFQYYCYAFPTQHSLDFISALVSQYLCQAVNQTVSLCQAVQAAHRTDGWWGSVHVRAMNDFAAFTTHETANKPVHETVYETAHGPVHEMAHETFHETFHGMFHGKVPGKSHEPVHKQVHEPRYTKRYTERRAKHSTKRYTKRSMKHTFPTQQNLDFINALVSQYVCQAANQAVSLSGSSSRPYN